MPTLYGSQGGGERALNIAKRRLQVRQLLCHLEKKLKQKALKYLSMICVPMTERWWLFPINPKNARREGEL